MLCGTRGLAKAFVNFDYGGITLYALPFQVTRLSTSVPYRGPTTPLVHVPMVWANPRSLATTRGISVLISSPPVTEMFHFTGSAVGSYEFTDN